MNCTFTGNTAERDGGAIFKGDAINCTFIGNTAHHGGAMNCEDNNRLVYAYLMKIQLKIQRLFIL